MYAALSVVVATTTGTALAITPASADGSDWPAANGVIAVNQGDLGVSVIDPSSATAAPKSLSGSGQQPAWSPTGSRVVSIVDSHLVTQRYDGTDLHALPTPLGDGFPNHPTYALNGQAVVYADNGRLELVPADGAYQPAYLMTTTQEPSSVCDFDATAGLGDTIYFARSNGECDTGNASIWSFDTDSGVLQEVIQNAFAPALSSDNSRMAYASYVDGHAAAFVSDPDGTGAEQISPADDTRDFSSFSWAPDGTSVLAQAVDGTTGDESVVRIDLSSGDLTTIGTNDGSPAWQPVRQAFIGRVYGSSSAATNLAASHWIYAPIGKDVPGLVTAKSAVIVSNANSTFASLAPSLAAKKGGPVLTTSAKSLDAGVQTELQRILPKGKTVYIVGGTSIVSSAVSSKLTSLGYKVTRLGSGSTRFVTSVSVAKTITSAPQFVFLATGEDYHSILEAEGAAGAGGTATTSVALMTDNSTMTPSVYEYLNSLNPKTTNIITVGTSAQTAFTKAHQAKHLSKWPSTVYYSAITASTNPGTAAALAKFWWYAPVQATFVNDNSWSDGIGGFSSMGPYSPVIWATSTALDSPDKTFLLDESASLQDVVVFGGTSSISSADVTAIGNAEAVSGHWTLQNYPNGLQPVLRGGAKAAIVPDTTTGKAATTTGQALPASRDGHPLPKPNAVSR